MALALLKPWTTQPTRVAELNTNHPLCPDYRVWHPPALRELITTDSPSSIRARRSTKAGGIGLAYSASTSDTPTFPFYPNQQADFSALVMFDTAEPSTTQAFCYQSNGSGSSNYNGFGANGTSLLEIHFGVDNAVANTNKATFSCQRGTGQLNATNDILLQAGQTTVAVAVVKSADAVLYINGSRGTALTGTANLTITPSFYRFAETGFTSAGRYLRGTIYAFYSWKRALSESEVKQISANPYQIFRGAETLSVPTYYPILSNLQATRGNTSASLRTNITY